MLGRLKRLFRHRWLDEADTRQAIPPDLAERLARRVAASERRHTGEVRIYVEAGLPASYIWRGATARERAVFCSSATTRTSGDSSTITWVVVPR